jgi:hypothetical protein
LTKGYDLKISVAKDFLDAASKFGLTSSIEITKSNDDAALFRAYQL